MTIAEFIELTGIKETSCDCYKCKAMCRNPCYGTPVEIERLIQLGFAPMLRLLKGWPGIAGTDPFGPPIEIIQATTGTRDAQCVFQIDGLCSLHAEGLKPIEGRFSIHDGDNITGSELRQAVIREWDTPEGKRVVELYRKTRGIRCRSIK